MPMTYQTLISISNLAAHLGDPDFVLVDARFSLADPDYGWRNYREAHIPGAVYAHLDEDLSAPVIMGITGRHPLPQPGHAAEVFSRWGIPSGGQVVVYDDLGGALAAVRVWWMLRWLGFDSVAVLDGGWQKWLQSRKPVRGGDEHRQSLPFTARPRPELVVSTADVEPMVNDPGWLVLDARSADRYRGENETIDPIAGHIPGAVSAPYVGNLNPDGSFRSLEQLRTRYQRLLGSLPAERTVVYCGSGVTSIHDILAIQHAGLGEARLYAGSWSEWITDLKRGVATAG